MPEKGHLPGTSSSSNVAHLSKAHPFVSVIAGFSRLLLHKWCASVQVRGLDRFLGVLRDADRQKRGQGILTYANHISVMDDPTIFGSLPKDLFRHSLLTRWTLGASDIMFTNALFSSFFRCGQVLPTDRGRGVFQPSLDDSIDLLETGNWVHMFPEGYVNLSRRAQLRRFKWGVGRILLEAGASERKCRPIVVPMWISGLDAMMPEPRRNPRWFPRPGANVTITFGEAINNTIDPILDRMSTFSTRKTPSSHTIEEAQAEADKALDRLDRLGPRYPSPPAASFPPHTPLAEPPGGVPWPVPLPKSRSARAVSSHGDSISARAARGLVAAELRAHLAKLGEDQGISMALAHRLMPG